MPKPARATAEGLDQALREQVATKADLATLEANLSGRIRVVEWMAGANITLTLIVLGKLLLAH